MIKQQHLRDFWNLVIFTVFVSFQMHAQESAEELAKKLANPVASLIRVPLQNNTYYGIDPYNGSKNTLNIQPVIPIKLSPKLNMITRFILPVVSQHNITGEDTRQGGLSDLTASTSLGKFWISCGTDICFS